ncbi:MAG: superinfection immunity protein [Alphaproteobacteria bacterium]|nr:superinfection immunity protein [Alphaproteobacteria bacterium]
MEILLIPALLYFIPTIVALLRGHHNAFAIFLTNLLFGWTIIGWLITLIWSTTAIIHRVQVQN